MSAPPSTRSLAALPAPRALARIWRGLAQLDAVLEPRWDRRVFSFDRDPSGSLGTVRENDGDVLYGLFLPDGSAILRGFSRDSPMNPFLHARPRRWPGLVEGMPRSLRPHADASAVEPDEVTFVIWWDGDGWRRGRQRFPSGPDPDGSAALLAPFTDAADRYVELARTYHGRTLARGPVAEILRGTSGAATLEDLMATKKATKKTTKKATKKAPQKKATKPAARAPRVDFGEAEFTIHCVGDRVRMEIEIGVVAEARVTEDLYQELFDHAKARILAVGKPGRR